MKNEEHKLSRRQFLKKFGIGSASALGMMAFSPLDVFSKTSQDDKPAKGDNNMTYRINHHTNDKVSLLGYGMMRLPRNADRSINQELVNQEVDYALAHGINYFDTAPAYGGSEVATGIALKRHPRNTYYIATKMSNQREDLWNRDKAKEMYYNSFKRLQTDYIDYYLLHAIGGGDGVETLKKRFVDNGLLDFLLEERKKGHIRNLGFSYHGDVKAFDWLVDHNDKYKWDFCQIEMNYIDWRHASNGKGWKKDADAEYLYNKSEKLGIQNVVMEPLLGGRLAKVPEEYQGELKAARPNLSPAGWAFTWVGSHPNILVALSGMTTMNVLEENVKTFSPLDPCTPKEYEMLERLANNMSGVPVIPCTGCHYCMPCPFGVDIPGNFAYYNDAVNKKILPLPAKGSADYIEKAKAYKEGYNAALPEADRATSCMDCEACLPKCPQSIRIPNQMARLVELINS